MLDSLFAGFEGRDTELGLIERFHGIPFMHYRTTNLLHSNRVTWLVNDMLPYANKVYGKGFDTHYALLLAKVHDDHERHLGDITLDVKMRMTPGELQWLKGEEVYSAQEIARKSPERVNGFWYQDLMLDAIFKRTLESQVVSLGDKIDGYGESRHEVAAGNMDFLKPLNNYIRLFSTKELHFPRLTDIFQTKHPFFSQPSPAPTHGTLHDSRSIIYPGNCPIYDRWKDLTLKQEGWKPLLLVKESSAKYTQAGIPGDQPSVHTS